MTCEGHKKVDCKCHTAVLNAYGGLVDAGQPEAIALDAARIVYSHHHPEVPVPKADLIVEHWVSAERMH